MGTNVRMNPNKEMIIKQTSGVVDGKNIFTYLDERVLLDEDHTIDVKLTVPTLNFKKGITIAQEANDETYFCGKDLVSYKNNLFTSTSTSLRIEPFIYFILLFWGYTSIKFEQHFFKHEMTD